MLRWIGSLAGVNADCAAGATDSLRGLHPLIWEGVVRERCR
jgi:hypothetical protein